MSLKKAEHCWIILQIAKQSFLLWKSYTTTSKQAGTQHPSVAKPFICTPLPPRGWQLRATSFIDCIAAAQAPMAHHCNSLCSFEHTSWTVWSFATGLHWDGLLITMMELYFPNYADSLLAKLDCLSECISTLKKQQKHCNWLFPHIAAHQCSHCTFGAIQHQSVCSVICQR